MEKLQKSGLIISKVIRSKQSESGRTNNIHCVNEKCLQISSQKASRDLTGNIDKYEHNIKTNEYQRTVIRGCIFLAQGEACVNTVMIVFPIKGGKFLDQLNETSIKKNPAL